MKIPAFAKLSVLPWWVKPLALGLLCAFLSWKLYAFGVESERAKWQTKQNAELVKQQEKILSLQTKNRELEHQRVLEAQALAVDYQEKLDHEKAVITRVLDDLRARTRKLSIPTRQAVPACNGGVSLSTAAGPKNNTETRAELSEQAAEFFVNVGSEADQAVIESNHVKDLLVQCRTHVEQITQLCGAQ